MEELRKYRENAYYDIEDVVEKLIQMSNLEAYKNLYNGLRNDLKSALYDLEAMAQNEYNADYYRTLYNILLVIAGMECF